MRRPYSSAFGSALFLSCVALLIAGLIMIFFVNSLVGGIVAMVGAFGAVGASQRYAERDPR